MFTIFTRASLLYFETYLVRKLVDLKNHRNFLHSGIYTIYSKSARLNLQTTALTYQNNIHCYISNLLKRLAIQYVLAVAIGLLYGLVMSQSRSLCDALMHTMHPCAEIHNAMSELTGNRNKTSEQHREMEVARITIDVKDLQIIHSCFTENFPFPEKAKLIFISTAVTAPQHSDINCDKANKISAKVYASLIKHTHLQKCTEKRRLLL